MARASNNEREYDMDYTPSPPEPSIPKVKMGRYQLDDDVVQSIKPVKMGEAGSRPYDAKAAAREDARYARDAWAGLTTKEAGELTNKLAEDKKIAREREAARKREEAQKRAQQSRGTYREPAPARAASSRNVAAPSRGTGSTRSGSTGPKTDAKPKAEAFVGPVKPKAEAFVGPVKPKAEAFVGPVKPKAEAFVGPVTPDSAMTRAARNAISAFVDRIAATTKDNSPEVTRNDINAAFQALGKTAATAGMTVGEFIGNVEAAVAKRNASSGSKAEAKPARQNPPATTSPRPATRAGDIPRPTGPTK